MVVVGDAGLKHRARELGSTVRKACHVMRSLNQGCSGDPVRLHTGTLSELTPPQPAEISAWQGWVELGWVPAHMSL